MKTIKELIRISNENLEAVREIRRRERMHQVYSECEELKDTDAEIVSAHKRRLVAVIDRDDKLIARLDAEIDKRFILWFENFDTVYVSRQRVVKDLTFLVKIQRAAVFGIKAYHHTIDISSFHRTCNLTIAVDVEELLRMAGCCYGKECE